MNHDLLPPTKRRHTVEQLEQWLAALRDIGLVLESTMRVDEVLAMAVERTTRLMAAERATLYLTDSNKGLVSHVVDGGAVSEIRLKLGQGVAGWVALHGRPLLVPDAYVDARFDPSWDKRTGFRTRCIICHPVRSQVGEVIGVVQVMNKQDGSVFDEPDLELLGLISSQLGLVIQNSQLMADLLSKNRALAEAKLHLERHNRELDLLLELERAVATEDTIDTLSALILKRTLDITNAGAGMIYRLDDVGAEIKIMSAGDPQLRVLRVPAGTGLAGWVAAKGEELCLPTPQADPRFTAMLQSRIGITLENAAAVPLHSPASENALGSLVVANNRLGRPFDDGDLALLRLVASRLGQGLYRLSTRDQRDRNRRLATVGRLLAGVLHDLKAPISVVSGYAELLAEKAGNDAEAVEDLSHIQRSLQRIRSMTEDIIAFTKGERKLLAAPVDVRSLVEGLLADLHPLFEATQVEAKLQLRTEGTIRLDEDKILRVFHNICRNAVEAMTGGGTLTIAVDQFGKDVVFSFTDTGTGISEEIQGMVFESFVTHGKQGGSGLGLAMAREIVEAHGGRITFITAPGNGTTFIVALPV